ncbi:MAG: hypothetical protein M0011_10730 [Elusimicrobia bacterium]|nr:hypothetical protein [Elusimicrobiota bacterium]
MKNALLNLSLLAFMASPSLAGAQPKARAEQYKPYSMEGGHFSCLVPESWELKRDKDQDEEYKIYEIELVAPKSAKAPIAIFISYYSKDNEDFNDYRDYIKRNSRNVAGETKTSRENYAPVKNIRLNDRKGFELSSETLEFLHPESKSDESVALKEKIYVLPAKSGFYVVRFSAPREEFAPNLKVFEKVARSFKGRP